CVPRLSPPRPPASTLFPYTTLFRSCRRDRSACPVLGLVRHRRSGRRDHLLIRRSSDPGGRGVALARVTRPDGPATGRAPGLGARDRKSTRLNSSHVKISYAVFCLKK